MFQDTKPGGSVVLNGDDPLLSTIGPVKGFLIRSPTDMDQDKNAVYATDVERLTGLKVELPAPFICRKEASPCVVPIPGIHMVSTTHWQDPQSVSKLGLTTVEIKRGVFRISAIHSGTQPYHPD